MEEEIPLRGGRVTPGVVRVGDTVRRPLCENSNFVHALLRHLESTGFEHSPRLLGIDDQGREILTYIEGWVPPDLGHFTVEQLREAARITARFHDACAGTPIAEQREVVCHHDLSPCNFVFRSGLPACMIDFDEAAPGPRRLDVGYAAWGWLDIGSPELSALEVGHRLESFLAAYGEHAPTDPLGAVVEAQLWLARRASTPRDDASFVAEVRAWARQCAAWVQHHRTELERGLREGGEKE